MNSVVTKNDLNLCILKMSRYHSVLNSNPFQLRWNNSPGCRTQKYFKETKAKPQGEGKQYYKNTHNNYVGVTRPMNIRGQADRVHKRNDRLEEILLIE